MPMLSLLIPCTVLLLLACSDSKKNAAPTAPDLGAVSLALIDIEFSGDAARALQMLQQASLRVAPDRAHAGLARQALILAGSQ